MNGVEILASSEVLVDSAFNWGTFGCVCGGVFALCFIIGIIVCAICKCDWENLIGFALVGLMLGGIFGAGVGYGTSIPLTYETRYKVIVSNEVQMNDFVEKYEILDQEGKIYTVRERQTEQND